MQVRHTIVSRIRLTRWLVPSIPSQLSRPSYPVPVIPSQLSRPSDGGRCGESEMKG
jgi:hypothetical protein